MFAFQITPPSSQLTLSVILFTTGKEIWLELEVVFSGSSGPIYGWKATLDRYKKTYSDKEKMGKLKFEILNVIALSPKVIQLQGKFNLTRSIGDAFGYFTLNWIKVKNRWYIISDHTSGSN